MLYNIYEFHENRDREGRAFLMRVNEITPTRAYTVKQYGIVTVEKAVVMRVHSVTEYTTCKCAADTPGFLCAPINKNLSDWGPGELVCHVYGPRAENVCPRKLRFQHVFIARLKWEADITLIHVVRK
jgi:hypothetical protein